MRLPEPEADGPEERVGDVPDATEDAPEPPPGVEGLTVTVSILSEDDEAGTVKTDGDGVYVIVRTIPDEEPDPDPAGTV